MINGINRILVGGATAPGPNLVGVRTEWEKITGVILRTGEAGKFLYTEIFHTAVVASMEQIENLEARFSNSSKNETVF